MRWKNPAFWIAIVSAALVVWLVWLDSASTSPGPVSAAHAQEPELASNGCELCHGPERHSLAAACSACHTEVAAQIERKAGLHGTLGADVALCGRCHSEHHGAEFDIAGAHAFALAGVPDPAHYDHAQLGFTLTGKHLTLACDRCHTHANAQPLAKGTQRFLGLEQRCASCHEDVHLGALPDCAACHGEEQPFAAVAEFVHTRAFELTGAHAGRACNACHVPGSAHAIEAEHLRASATDTANVRSCASCHTSPHRAPFLADAARASGGTPDATCATCHPVEHTSFTDARATLSAAQHAATGFALVPPHERVACDACHPAGTRADEALERATFASFVSAHPGRGADDCAACHGDPHGGEFETGVFATATCTTCHARTHFEPASFDLAEHARTTFALTGAHAAVACAECHRETRTLRVKSKALSTRVFHGARSECSACHADAHAGAFERAGLPRTLDGKQDCERCHTTSSFGETEAPFDHARWTTFALDGAHARAECSTCHTPAAQPDVTGRTFGRVRDHVTGDPTRCVTCHADVHAGAFDVAALPAVVDGRSDCARCHTTENFGTAAAGFDHGRWTGFELAGAHASADCAACHRASDLADARGRRFGRCAVTARAAAATCTSCHVDAHGGAFDRGSAPARIDGRSGCLRCHDQVSFQNVRPGTFDHAVSTGFTLAGAHLALECASCHEPVRAADGRTQRFAQARGTRCDECHADPHAAQFATDGRTDCARCHLNGPTFTTLTFDHQKDARFALDATHAKLACAACHTPASLPDGTRTVRYKPLGTSCGDCHDPRGAQAK